MENLNSVAFIAKISEIKQIPGADNIEQAFVEGWSCIIKKGQYSEGGLVICATTDAVIPEKLAEDMSITNYLRPGNRVRTVKLRGVYSECLIIPLKYSGLAGSPKEGKDMMQCMGISKYEAPVKQIQLSSGRKIRYSENPNFHVYHKFPNMKNVKGMFNEGDYVEITRKIHGTNARYGIVKKKNLGIFDRIKIFFGNPWAAYEFVVGSHNVEKGSDSQGFYDTNVWYEISDKYQIKQKLWEYAKHIGQRAIGSGITLYGEIYGAGIQKNYDYGLKDIKFAGFDFTENGKYCATLDAKDTIVGYLGLPYVEVLHNGPWSQEVQDSFVFNNFIEGSKVPHEGVVIKIQSGDRAKVAKVINPDYLIASEKFDYGDSH